MPWQELTTVTQRLSFVQEHRRGVWAMATLCAEYGISEKTGYKWLARYGAEGELGLRDRSHAPHVPAHQVSAPIVDALLALRRAHPTWGPRKLLAYLAAQDADAIWPVPSTVGALLKRRGLVRPRRRRAPLGHPGRPRTLVDHANQLWTADFKGQFRTGDGHYCYPLTIADAHSRFLLACHGLPSVHAPGTRRVFERVFREYGLPEAIRTDNGVPFASVGLARLSRLSVWWLRLGIRRELTEPARPAQNGRHERMHKTLKAETAHPPAATRAAQQRRFATWCTEFNTVRPHEALGQRPPASAYARSPRPYPTCLTPPEYPAGWERRRVSGNGCFCWHAHFVMASHVLEGQDLGLAPVADGLWSVYLGSVLLARFDEHTLRLTAHYPAPTSLHSSPIIPV